MENTNEIKNIISEAKNICLIPSQTNEPESLTSALALFYTLKELNKNVNLITDEFPEKLSFLIPSIDFITSPKNLVISVPQDKANVSQVYYEKNEKSLKIHLTVDKGSLKKEDFSFYFSETRPDLIITLGVKSFRDELENKLDSFGFLLDIPILNIDNKEDNLKFGQINLIEQKSLSEIVLEVVKLIKISLPNFSLQFNKNTANCILAGLMIYYDNFKNTKTSPLIFEEVADLIKKGAEYHQVNTELNKMTKKEMGFLNSIFLELQNNKKSLPETFLTKNNNYTGSFVGLNSSEFNNFGENEANFAVEKIKNMGFENDLLVLWQSHASDPTIKGFFYSKKQNLINKIFSKSSIEYNEIENLKITTKNDWIFLSIPGTDINLAKESIIKLLV